jgi:hypothetical protein
VKEDANSEAVMAMVATAAMAVTAATEDSLVDAEEAMEATAMNLKVLAVAWAAIREVGHSSTKANHAVVDTNNRVWTATSRRDAAVLVVAALMVAVETHVSVP